MLTVWARINYQETNTVDGQMLWYNFHIRISKTPVFWKNCYSKGLIWTSKLFPNGRKINLEEAKEFNLDQMSLNQLKAAITQQSKKSLRISTSIPKYSTLYDSMFQRKHIAHYAYSELIQKSSVGILFLKLRSGRVF